MNLKKLSNEELDQQLKGLVKRENELLKHILLHIAEVDRRKMYLEMSYPSLFTYLTKHIGYSNGSAQRRIDAARLSYDVPGVINDIASGNLNLQQVSLVQASIREVQSKSFGTSSKRPVESAVKIKLMDELKNKSNTESQVIVAKVLNIKPKIHTKVKHHQDESVTLEVNLKKSQWKKLEQVRDLASHSLPSGSWDEVIEYAMDLVIRQKTYQEKKKSPQNTSQEKKSQKNKSQSHCHLVVNTTTHGKFESCSKDQYQKTHYQVEVENLNPNENQSQTHCHSVVDAPTYGKLGIQSKDHYQMAVKPEHEPKPKTKTTPLNKTLTPKLKQFILARDRHCQHIDPKSGKICAATQFLQVDHIHPRWDRGSHAAGNLRVLCGAHNRWR